MIHFWVFGSMDLRDAKGVGVPEVLAQPKRSALLAYLVAAAAGRGFVQRHAPVALFWPELDEPRARHALSKSIHHLRRSLGSEVLVSLGDGAVGLDRSHLWCDLLEFDDACREQRWEEAVALYDRGELLEGFHVAGAPDFEPWLEDQRARVRRRCARAYDALVRDHEEGGALDAAASWAERAVHLSPYDERAVRRLIDLLARSGNRGHAIEVFERFEARLERDFEVGPAPETVDLVDRVRSRGRRT